MTNSQTAREMRGNPNFSAIKGKQQIAWGSGDYARIGVTLQVTGENLCEAMDLRAGQSVLDVAAGNGNVTLAAARRFCDVVSTDYVETLLEQGQVRAQAEKMAVEFMFADAEDLPFADNRFDNVVSTFGVMFAPDQATCARELMRVCRPGGKIGMANWTPSGFIGQLFKIIGEYMPPPAGVSSPALWGTPEFVERHFAAATSIAYTSRHFTFRYPSPQYWVDLFRNYYGPLHKAFEALDDAHCDALENDVLGLIGSLNRSGDETMVLDSEYLEVVVTR